MSYRTGATGEPPFQPGCGPQRARPPQPPHAVVARQSVGAIGAEDEHLRFVERLRQAGEQPQGRCVRPVEVVQDQQQWLLAREMRERTADSLEQRGAVACPGARPEFGQQHGKVHVQRPASRQSAGLAAQVRAQRRDQRSVRRGRALTGRAPQNQRARAGRDRLDQARLANPRLAGDQDQRPVAGSRPCDRILEPLPLSLSPDQPSHWASLCAANRLEKRIRHVGTANTAAWPVTAGTYPLMVGPVNERGVRWTFT